MATEYEPVLITEPGIRDDLINDDYHAQSAWFGSSQLKGYLPEWFKPAGATAALDLGTLAHALILEPDTEHRFVALDPASVGRKADGTTADNPKATKAWREAVAEHEAAGRTVVEATIWQAAHRMADAVLSHLIAGPLMTGDGVNEQSLFWRDDAGVQHRARPDRRIPGALLDLKTTVALPSAADLARAVTSYGYDLSAVHYLEGARALGLADDGTAFVHVWVGKTEPYLVTVTEFGHDPDGADFWHRGRSLRVLAIERATNEKAPRYLGATEPLTLTAPPWALRGVPA